MNSPYCGSDMDPRDSTQLCRRFAIISHTLPPANNGQAIMLDRLLRPQPAETYCAVLTPDSAQSAASIPCRRMAAAWRVPHWPIPILGSAAWLINNLLLAVAFFWGLLRIVREEKCDAVVACTGHAYELPMAWLAARWAKVRFYPYYFDWYAYKFDCVRGTVAGRLTMAFARQVERFLLPMADGVLVPNSQLAAELYELYGIKADIVPNPTGFTLSQPQEQRAKGPHETLQIAFAGAIYDAHWDAFENLLEAIRLLPKGAARLTVYTDLTPDAWKAYSADILQVRGRLQPCLVEEELRRADVLFLPLAFRSPYPEIVRTSAPGKLGDYLACGVPLLVHAPAGSFVCDYCRANECGLVVDSPDPEALAQALSDLAGDAALRARLVANGLACARADFLPAVVREKFLRALNVESAVSEEVSALPAA